MKRKHYCATLQQEQIRCFVKRVFTVWHYYYRHPDKRRLMETHIDPVTNEYVMMDCGTTAFYFDLIVGTDELSMPLKMKACKLFLRKVRRYK